MPKLLVALFAICLAGHVWLGFVLGLSVDEAHYALYALHPALSYFDHPPLVGWMQIPFVWMGGADWMMRVVPLVLWGLTACLLFFFATLTPPPLSRQDGGRGGLHLVSSKEVKTYSFVLVGLFLLSPVHQLLGLALVPDSLLLPLTLWVMILAWKLSSDVSCKPYWIWLGVTLGLAGLSKYSGIFLALGAAIVLFAAHGLALLKSRNLWLAVLIAAVLVSPVFIWNAQNDWASFSYQINHAAGNQEWRLANVLRFDLVQLLAYGMLPLVGLVVFLWRRQSQHRQLARISLAFGLPILVFAAYSAGRNSALPHWTAGAWLAFMPAAALGLQHLWLSSLAGKISIAGLGLVQALSVLGLAMAMTTGGYWQNKPVLQGAANPFADLHDWEAASKKAATLQKEHNATALAVSNWTLASRLAWYARAKSASDSPNKVWALDGKNKQFDMWFGKLEYGASYIWVDWSQMPMQPPVGCHKLSASSYQGQFSGFDFYKCGPV